MNINKTDNIAFQTNIKFVSPKFFIEHAAKMNSIQGDKFVNVSHWDVFKNRAKHKELESKNIFSGYAKDIFQGFTSGVRTCSAGIIANIDTHLSTMFHVSNRKDNLRNLDGITNYLNGTNAILVGSKDWVFYSRAVYEKLKNLIEQKGIPLTSIFPNPKGWEFNLIYHATNDTAYLSANKTESRGEYIKSMDDLKSKYEYVEISPKDNVQFYTPEQEDFIINVGYHL